MQIVAERFNSHGGVVTVQADTVEAVQSMAARELAIQAGARAGLSRPGIAGDGGTYPVDSQGQCSDAVLAVQTAVAGFRCDYQVQGGL